MTWSTARAAGALLIALCLAACATDSDTLPAKNPFRPEDSQAQDRREQRLAADKLYRLARKGLDVADYAEAINRYDQLIQRYPFTEFATQGELERVFAYYRSYREEEAISAADRFLRDHPRHASADYIYYLRGRVNADKDERALDFLPGVDSSLGDVSNSRRAFEDFALLLRKYPQSRYAGDARARMVALRNRIARHELQVVDFYMRRGAWLAAAKRAEAIIAEYPGAPATLDALRVLQTSYAELGLKDQAEDVKKILAAQKAAEKAANPG